MKSPASFDTSGYYISVKIKEKGGIITHNAAKQLVLNKEGLQQIKEEMFNAQIDDHAKSDPVMAHFLVRNSEAKTPKREKKEYAY